MSCGGCCAAPPAPAIHDLFLADLAAVVARENFSEYPELTEKLAYIQKVISIEEERFAQTVDQGSEMLSQIIEKTKAAGHDALTSEDVFKLYDTFGFPIDLTREIAAESGLGLDEEGFTALMAEQRARARAAQRRHQFARRFCRHRIFRL